MITEQMRRKIGKYLVKAKYNALCLLWWPDWPDRIAELLFELAAEREAREKAEAELAEFWSELEFYRERIAGLGAENTKQPKQSRRVPRE